MFCLAPKCGWNVDVMLHWSITTASPITTKKVIICFLWPPSGSQASASILTLKCVPQWLQWEDVNCECNCHTSCHFSKHLYSYKLCLTNAVSCYSLRNQQLWGNSPNCCLKFFEIFLDKNPFCRTALKCIITRNLMKFHVYCTVDLISTAFNLLDLWQNSVFVCLISFLLCLWLIQCRNVCGQYRDYS